MDNKVKQALIPNKELLELESYFLCSPFNTFQFDISSTKTIMIDSGYTRMIAIKFWRILETVKLIDTHKNQHEYSFFLLEVFLNQSLATTDILAKWANHFLSLGIQNGADLSIHRTAYYKKIMKLLENSKDFLDRFDEAHNWSKNKLYPYRNIVHHKGELSSCIKFVEDTTMIMVPREDCWNFNEIYQKMKNYPDQTSYLIDNNLLSTPNFITGSSGDTHKYIEIDIFVNEWKNKIYNIIKLHFEIVNFKTPN